MKLIKGFGAALFAAAGESGRVADMLAELERMRVRIAEHGPRQTLGAQRKYASDPRA